MDIVAQIELYNNLFYIFAGVAVVSFLLAVFLFFRFDIPQTYAMLTGKTRRKTIEEMAQRNAQSGRMRMSYPIGNTGETKGHTGRRGKTANQKSGNLSGRMGSQKSGNLSGRTAPPRPAQPAAPPGPAAPPPPQPAPSYAPPAPAPAYSTDPGYRPETGVLKVEAPETMVLQSGPDGPINDSATTEILKPQMNPDFTFRVTENIIEIHTNELI